MEQVQTFFYFGRSDEKGKCFFRLYHDPSEIWEREIPIPYPPNHTFWEREYTDPVVLKKVDKLAEEYNAPDWVYEPH